MTLAANIAYEGRSRMMERDFDLEINSEESDSL